MNFESLLLERYDGKNRSVRIPLLPSKTTSEPPGPSTFSSSSLLLSSLELSDAQIYEPQIRALFGTASHFCEAVVVELRPFTLCSEGTTASIGEQHQNPKNL
jgi:hypothetical protein